jgi:hypothetical protein
MTAKQTESLLEVGDKVLAGLQEIGPLLNLASVVMPAAAVVVALALDLDSGLRALIAEVEPTIKGQITNPDPLIGPDPTKV